ncbi:uncharacterized protein LOC131664136 [Phymastichus coffea]|uniref:uncharacterized protein LOC131664136 n=1 Tax=Phymastichus coffea TaxID=108790 RepID=UPI00273C2AE7|nr:uncharacterized protein LOC131664136 [Phymastichus coffea]XP_058791006.1 uncharacterized protein LOC131664136 [Phymastichus coffea]
MREKSSGCKSLQPQASHNVRAMTEMCSREPSTAVLQQLGKQQHQSNGKGPVSPQPQLQQQRPNSSSSSTTTEEHELAAPASLPNNSNHTTPGGRLKFFKDGKFILELSHRRDGERTTWFPVPKKTFWPPASVTPSRQESSASLSVSDDNSSIQSSPWQRDHCWKQSHPRRNISTKFNFYYRRNPKTRLCLHPRLIARKRRQPLDPNSSLAQLQDSLANHQKPQSQLQQQVLTATGIRKLNGVPANKSINIIIDKLARLLDPNVVSPRKRILRELERVTLEDQASKRRATPPHTTNTTVHINESPAPVSKQLSSYSITSILGEDKPSGPESEPGFLRNLLKPQERHHHSSPQHQVHSPQHQVHSPQHQLSPSAQPIYPRSSRMDPGMAAAAAAAAAYLSPNAAASSIHQPPLYGMPMMPPAAAYRAPPFCWMHYSQPVHYPPMPLYPAPPQPSHHTPSPSPPAHHYKDYREQTLTPPSDMPLNLSKHAG